jgi:hypothetical protein
MSDLLETVIEAHGGLERWNQLNNVSARLFQGGALWALKGQAGVLDDVVVTASLHEERVSHRPFGAADWHSSFTPERVAIETDDGTVLEALDQPRASFADEVTGGGRLWYCIDDRRHLVWLTDAMVRHPKVTEWGGALPARQRSPTNPRT